MPQKIIVTKNNDMRSYRQNSDKLLSLGFKEKYNIEDAIKEILNAYKGKKLKDNRSFYTVNWMKQIGLDNG